ncbi:MULTISPECIES: D-2-hydroxyacid dehydrogenase [unclassified Novosphingobium]|uniref:D-2-hydroxyacid dehydrogenase n=1 Tax=unclassified Novosphingobium TaxID=2644732 RepID=UPI0025FBE23A|nr:MULTISPECIES: D-2-hydroxyacid dehydrogenase [unclassified Novosphingobium]HQV03988.1 D-2-hydroxyacid dehydrogenase [Novosphingobium sp.]
MEKICIVLNALLKPMIEPHLPDWADLRWYTTKEEAFALAPEAEIGWFDMHSKDDMARVFDLATRLKWLNSIYAGVEAFPLDVLAQRGVVLTNGAGINAVPIAEYVVLLMLAHSKNYREVVRAQERREWLKDSPGKRELFGSSALILGYGAIGQEVEKRLAGFGMGVSKVRRSPGPGVLGPDEWRGHLGEFDWIVIAVPATAETEGMIGAAELAAMKADAVLVNVARGSVIDQDALTEALNSGRIGGALLDVTTPEPLPEDHPLWALDNAQITMHLTGKAQNRMFQRSAARFLENLARYGRGERLEPVVDYAAGY